MVDLIRSEYGYSDEYILDKTLKWIYNCNELIHRRLYDDKRTQALLNLQAISKMFGNKDPILSFDEMMKKKEVDDKLFEKFQMSDDKLASLGISKINPSENGQNR